MRCSMILLLTASLAVAAPAPIPRPAPVPQIEGSWQLVWGFDSGGTSPATFSRDKTFGCFYAGEPWHGTWSLDGNVLTVEEVRGDGHRYTWKATLEPPVPGVVGHTGV